MIILYLINSLDYGGAEKQTVMDANMMVLKNEVFLGYFIDGPQKEIIDKGVKVIKIKKKNYLLTAINLARLVEQNNIQLIHSSLFAAMTISALCSLFCKVKVIWHFHSHEYDIPFRSKLAFRYLAKFKSVKKILFVNHELMDHFKSYNFLRSKTGILHNHSEICDFDPAIRVQNRGVVNIGYIGRVVEIKRPDYLVDMASFFIEKNFTQFKIHIVGDGASLKSLKKYALSKAVNNYFEYHGFQSSVKDYYREFDFFVNPSSEECLSMAMIDAGMMALPIVAFNVGGNNEIIVDNKTGFIASDKEDFFRECMVLCIKASLRSEMGANAHQHCIELFSKEKHLAELNKIYQEVM